MDKQIALYLYSGVPLANKKNKLLVYTTWINLRIIILNAKRRHKRVHTVSFHLYGYLELSKLIYSKRNQINDYQGQRVKKDWLQRGMRQLSTFYLDWDDCYTSVYIVKLSTTSYVIYLMHIYLNKIDYKKNRKII